MRPIFRTCLSLAFVLLPVAATAESLPNGVSFAGRDLAAVSCGVREMGWFDLFAAALYLPAPAEASALTDPGRPKIVRLEIRNADLIRGAIPEKWREPLRRSLSDTNYLRLKDLFGQFGDGDVVSVLYRPQHGVSLSLNNQDVLFEPGHGVVEALISVWSERDPVQQKFTELTAKHPC